MSACEDYFCLFVLESFRIRQKLVKKCCHFWTAFKSMLLRREDFGQFLKTVINRVELATSEHALSIEHFSIFFSFINQIE
jgi:hypothetical protein